jgi:hypothetical protein
MSRSAISLALLILSLFFGVTSLITLVPYPTKMMSDLGYFSACPFAPWSTLTLLMLGGVCWAVRGHIQGLPKT